MRVEASPSGKSWTVTGPAFSRVGGAARALAGKEGCRGRAGKELSSVHGLRPDNVNDGGISRPG